MTNTKTITGHKVIIQSCWLDQDNDIIANIGIKINAPSYYTDSRIIYQHVIISGDNIKVEHHDKFGKDEIAGFIKDNLAEVKDLAVSLLRPEERDRLAQMRLL